LLTEKYRSRSGKVISLTERVNDCFQRSMNGKPLAYDSAKMNNILASLIVFAIPSWTPLAAIGIGGNLLSLLWFEAVKRYANRH
jgi:thiosulfate dehydrogenase